MKKMKLITESFYSVQMNESAKDKKRLYIEGIFQTAEKKNQNGRIYKKSLLEREVEKFMSKIEERQATGELGHPENRADTDLSKAAIHVEHLEWQGNDVLGKALVLSTPYGQIVKNLWEDKVKFGISSRGLGTVNENSYVNDDYNLLTWDIVSNASTYGSKFVNGILEGKEFTIPETKKNEPTVEEIQEALKEHEKKIWQVIDKISKEL